tara:strand:- start:50 stop:535 length:486 start_codon:yes stop_codon:yes gene_type:complete
MAIKDTSRKPFVEDNDVKIKIGLDLPIRRDDSIGGFFASTTTTIEAVKNNIRNLLQTNTGERFFQPNLGVNLRQILFEQITEENLVLIQDSILDKLEIYLPFVEVRDIQVMNNEDDNSINKNEIKVKIVFNIKRDPNTLESLTLSFNNESTSETTTTTGGY